LVKVAYAQCAGTVQCGLLGNYCTCSNPDYSCSQNGPCAYGRGTCSCSYQCGGSSGSLNCSGISNQATCESASPRDCGVGKCILAENPCSWSSGGCTPGACDQNMSDSCFTGTDGGCYRDGWNGCDSTFIDCDLASGCDVVTSNPVNGACDSTHYNCTDGSSDNEVAGATAWTWDCLGSNGGSDASCSESNIPGWVQGCKILGFTGDCYGAGNSVFTLGSAPVNLDGTAATTLGNSALNSYYFPNITPGSHTVTIPSAPTGYNVTAYSACTSSTGCHTTATGQGSTANITVPSNSYVDLYWHYSAVPSTCTLSLSSSSAVAGFGTTVTYTGTVSTAASSSNVRLWLE
jgi:hypothetical protein